MGRLSAAAILGLAALALLVAGRAGAYDDGDWQYWNRESIEGDVSKNLKAKIDVEFRFGDNCSELYHQYSELGLSHRFCAWFELGLNYRQIYEKKSGTWKKENRPHLNATFKWSWCDFKLEDRSRLEYRVREGKDDVFRYRNRLTLKFPLKWTALNVQPYIADEIFLDFDEGELNRNRLYLGASSDLRRPLKLELHYLWQSSKSKDCWIDHNIIGTKLKAAF